MFESANALLTPTFLQSVWSQEYEAFKGSEAEDRLIERLNHWVNRKNLSESSAQSAFIRTFFIDTWGYNEAGTVADDAFTLYPQHPVPGAGAGGGMGQADLAMGFFGSAGGVPQVLCEYKGVGALLDAPQARKGNQRSPVDQALDYLRYARRGFLGNEPVTPNFAMVTDMNEFRLHWWDRGRTQSIAFVIRPRDLFQNQAASRLVGNDEAARFARYAFLRLFHSNMLLTGGGPPQFVRLIAQRRGSERKIEEEFYSEYRAVREELYTALLASNGLGTPRYPGTPGKLVRLAQKILDRLLFIAYCDDMGRRLDYPPKLLKDTLKSNSVLPMFDPNRQNIWQDVLSLFTRMNEGGVIGTHTIPRFNGGLFAPDPVLENLRLPNSVFCRHHQGASDETIKQYPGTLLFLLGRYDFAADLGGSRERSLGLYTLGRIFEQSITELEMLEAEADGRPSINRLSRRKTDGVYNTPEWVV